MERMEKEEEREKETTKSSFRRTCLNLYRTGVERDVSRRSDLYGELNDGLQMRVCDRSRLHFPGT